MSKEIECPYCYGEGTWEAECCNGSGGCSCHGQPVFMGNCNVCKGSGKVTEGEFNESANSEFIMQSGVCFLGSGPSTGFWSDKPALNY